MQSEVMPRTKEFEIQMPIPHSKALEWLANQIDLDNYPSNQTGITFSFPEEVGDSEKSTWNIAQELSIPDPARGFSHFESKLRRDRFLQELARKVGVEESRSTSGGPINRHFSEASRLIMANCSIEGGKSTSNPFLFDPRNPVCPQNCTMYGPSDKAPGVVYIQEHEGEGGHIIIALFDEIHWIINHPDEEDILTHFSTRERFAIFPDKPFFYTPPADDPMGWDQEPAQTAEEVLKRLQYIIYSGSTVYQDIRNRPPKQVVNNDAPEPPTARKLLASARRW